MAERLDVHAPSELFAFLAEALPGWGRNTLRERLDLGCVLVNGEVVRRRNAPLAPGDEVTIVARGEAARPARPPAPFPLLHLDEDLVAIDKPVGLLSVSTDRERDRTALALLRAHLAAPHRPAHLWPAHRLDRETSGVLLFTRSRAVKDLVQGAWGTARKQYWAVVHGRPRAAEGAIDLPLWEDERLRVRTGDGPGARPARTRYRTLRTAGDRSLLEVELDSGRRHQIRAHLAALGHPVVGDERAPERAPRLGLHALRLELSHPTTGAPLAIEAAAPRALLALLDQ